MSSWGCSQAPKRKGHHVAALRGAWRLPGFGTFRFFSAFGASRGLWGRFRALGIWGSWLRASRFKVEGLEV